MDNGALIPMGAFAGIALIVAIISLAKMRDKEAEVQQSLHLEELDHQHKMKELEAELERVKQGTLGNLRRMPATSEHAPR